jgi:glycosyltransferase involved in cell wall biosynthesis
LIETFEQNRGIPKLRLIYPRVPSMLSAARTLGPDIIVQSCSGFETAAMAWIAARIGIPFVHRIACDTDTDGREHLYQSRASQLAFRYGLARAQFVICQNEYQFGQIGRRFPSKHKGILHNAIILPSGGFNASSRVARRYIAWLAVFRRQKNLQLLFRVAQSLPHIEFRVAGKALGRPDLETANAIEKLGRLSNVRFEGYLRRTQIADFLRSAIALLSTSDYEGFSNTYLEALAEGTPVIARNIVDPDGIIARNALGAIARDKSELPEAVQRVFTLDAPFFAELSRRCRNYVEKNHTPEAAATKFVSMLEPMIDARRSGHKLNASRVDESNAPVPH